MPVILKIEHKDKQRTAVWEVKEDEFALLEIASLNKTDLDAFHLISNPGRRLEWLAVRALVKEFYDVHPSIDYHENGKPRLVNHTDKISISHSGKMVAIALHSNHNPGVDIEMLNPRIYKIANRYLNEAEKAFLGASPSVAQLTIVWGAKEVMFKVYEHGGISFKDDFSIQPFAIADKGLIEGILAKDGKTSVIPMEYIQIGDYMLVQTNYDNRSFENNSEL